MKILKNYETNNLIIDFALKNKIKNIFESPQLEKIIISCGVKDTLINSNKILYPLLILKLITGQKPKITQARKSIANFKLREGKIIGCKVTLRGHFMHTFIQKFIYIILPQLIENKTFKYKNRKSTKAFSIGISDCSVFPELDNQYELINNIYGMNITFVLKGKSLQKDNLFLSGMKIPFDL
jgi:large subunit ribosomal protein L5